MDMVMTIAWFTARARISCGTKFKVIRTSTFMYRRVARITAKLCIYNWKTQVAEKVLYGCIIFL